MSTVSGVFSADNAVADPSFQKPGNFHGFFHARTRSPLSPLNLIKFYKNMIAGLEDYIKVLYPLQP